MLQGETERVGTDRQYSQGDVIKLDQGEVRRSLPDYGVIINADCDLEHGRTDGVIAYLPLYTFRQYLELFWIPDQLNLLLAATATQMESAAKLSPSEIEDLKGWLLASPADEVACQVSLASGLRGRAAEKTTILLKKMKLILENRSDHFSTFKKICQLEDDAAAYAHKQLVVAKKSIGDGHLFISELVGENGIGYVIRMRRIYSIDYQNCFFTEADKLSSSDGGQPAAHRIARLSPIYRFKFAQLFAGHFSRVGLPDEIMNLSGLAIEALASEISGGDE